MKNSSCKNLEETSKSLHTTKNKKQKSSWESSRRVGGREVSSEHLEKTTSTL